MKKLNLSASLRLVILAVSVMSGLALLTAENAPAANLSGVIITTAALLWGRSLNRRGLLPDVEE